ncbi:speckle-type POZ protein-like [Microplitis mediator]|uniref:speckle-type POZ protein-like n=1 Tax=Microplitis mediator TaxID=375433 RepID=UPI0025571A47|nr:speckle-type POZ protein-like [Microplitis mediator]
MPLKKIEQNVHKFVYTWVIKNVSHLLSGVDSSTTTEIQVAHKFSSEFESCVKKWYVRLMLVKMEVLELINLVFDARYPADCKNHVTCNFYVVDADENCFFVGRKNRKFDHALLDLYYNQVSSCALLTLLKTRNNLFPNDEMTLRVEIITYLDENPILPFEYVEYFNEPDVDLSDFILKYKCRQNDGDVIIKVKDIEFPVHKTVLETRCSVLYKIVARHEQMFGSNNNQVTLTNIEPDIFKRVLEFIYTGQVEDLDDYSENLLEAASEYKLIRLIRMCEFSIVNCYLTFKNYNEVEKLAIRCGASKLLKNVRSLKFMMDKEMSLKDVSCTPSGTIIITNPNGEKSVAGYKLENGVPEGVKIVPESSAPTPRCEKNIIERYPYLS